ncbi:MAG: gliding motility-associated C-terminal domain-containing protein, partial [Fluviicola sp.]|nr:gliding motility-associated C-terminal domain-containing protein [Fluviicola sp.]
SSCPPASGSVDNYREYLGGQLSTPLVAGQSYCVQMYVNLATKSGWGIDKLGFYFYNSASPIAKDFCASPTPIQIPLADPKLLSTSGTPLVDTVNWVLVNWNYIAQGGENRFAIGNFFDKTTQVRAANDCATTNLQGGTYSYYFIDDVSVTSGTCCITTVNDPGNVCVTDAPFNLVPVTAGGTFSGTGITNATTGTFDPSIAGAGTFTITYTLPCGSESIQITVNNCTNLAVCQETNGDLTVSGGTAPYTWQTQSVTQDCSACLVGCVFPPGCAINVTTWTTYSTNATATPGTLPIQVLDNAGNTELITTLASIPQCAVITPCPTITVTTSGVQNVTCNGDSDGAATATASGGTSPYAYVWTPGNLNGATQTALAANTYTITATDNAGCTGTTTVTIAEYPVLSATSSSTPSDCAVDNGTGTVNATGGLAPYQYAWLPSGGSNATATGLAAGNYTVTITDAAGCQITEAIVVASNGGPTISTTILQNVSCNGLSDGSASVTITGGTAPFATTWTPSGETTTTATQLPAGNNTVTVVDNGGCEVSAIVTITAPASLQISGTSTDEDCGSLNGAITTTTNGGTTPYSYSWTGSAATTASLTGLNDGNYDVTVTDDNGCTASASFVVNQIGSLSVTVNPTSAVINEGDTVQLNASGGLTYLWEPSAGLSCTTCPDPIASPSTSTIYQVTVTDASGCSGVETVSIVVNPNCGEIFIPSIFSPNGDNNNDALCAMGNCFAEVTFTIYNRWGEKVFETDDLSVCWDATYKNKPVNADVFVYKLVGKLLNGTSVDASGNIQVVR